MGDEAERSSQNTTGAEPRNGDTSVSSRTPGNAAPPGGKRLTSLDAFRGLTILGMLLVNNVALNEATPSHLTHAAWASGIHFADLVFPWFLLIMGVAIPYSIASSRRKGLTMWRYRLKALGRAAALVLLGCLIDSSLARQPIFDLGVLQIIGLAYLVGALLYPLRPAWKAAAAALLLAGHWAAIRFIPIPGIGAGAFTENANLIKYLNETYLQAYHLSGLVSVIPTSAMALAGSVVGDLMRAERPAPGRKVLWMAAAGATLMLGGWLWNLDLPFNKPVWSAPYIVYTAGLGSFVLAVFYLLVDVAGWRAPAFPLVVFGSNAIVAYVAPILVKLYILQVWTLPTPDGAKLPLQQAFQHLLILHAGQVAGGWLYTASYIVFWWLVLLYLYRKKIFVRV
jgi:predicted acyltransferase